VAGPGSMRRARCRRRSTSWATRPRPDPHRRGLGRRRPTPAEPARGVPAASRPGGLYGSHHRTYWDLRPTRGRAAPTASEISPWI
jgi:hypothetical protein